MYLNFKCERKTMSKIVNTCVIYGNLKVYYDYIKSKPLNTLNPMGNFYRFSHLHKETQRFMENYLKSGEIPKKGEEINSETLCSKLIVTDIIFGYQRTEGEEWIHNLEKQFVEIKNKLSKK